MHYVGKPKRSVPDSVKPHGSYLIPCENERADRVAGMAISQATSVHDGIHYDIKVDTTKTSPEKCARIIRQNVHQ